ncbi:UNVERIFIED_CONTAM: hypothetical protein FKN15_029463 [Acipenser sinensis]
MAQQLELIAGCYEQIVFGYRVQTEEKKWTSDADFSHHAHTASLSAVAVNDRYIATGSKDETIQLYDIKKRVEYGSLLHHDGHVSADVDFEAGVRGGRQAERGEEVSLSHTADPGPRPEHNPRVYDTRSPSSELRAPARLGRAGRGLCNG